MHAPDLRSRLLAILAADAAGYSRLMALDDRATVAALDAARAVFREHIAAHGGRVIDMAGDSVLAVFELVSGAVSVALAIQQELDTGSSNVRTDRRLRFRIGVHLGEIIEKVDGTVYGDGVNVAARLQGMAEPGGVLISQVVRESVAGKFDVAFNDNGERKFKNISRPIRVWSWPRRLSASRAEGKPRIFVAEFHGSGEQEVRLATDLVDELRAHLARLTGLEIGTDRGEAHYIAEGGVRLAAGRSRVFARLTAVDGDRQIWSDRYDEDTDDPFEILDRCAPRMAMSVRRRVAAADAARLANRPLDELSFEELLALAGVSFFTPTKAGWRGGGKLAEQALEVQPNNFMALAMAAAGLGLAEFLYGFRKPEEAVTGLAFRRTEEARRLNSRSDMLHVTHGLLLLFARRRHRDSAAAARRALEVNPEYNMGLWTLGAAQVFMGDWDIGAQNATRAVNVDIRDPYVHLYSRIVAYGHWAAGRFDQAVDWFEKAEQLAPGLAPNLAGLAVSRWHSGDEEGARDSIVHLLEEETEFRLREMHPLPFQDVAVWDRFIGALRATGAPE